MLESFLITILAKLQESDAQIDFGNALVGFATLCLALITLWIALRSGRAANNKAIAEFRRQWVDDLRRHLADHSKSAFTAVTTHTNDDTKGYAAAIVDLLRVETYVRLQLNPAEPDHVKLADSMKAIRFWVRDFAKDSDDATLEKLNSLRADFINCGNSVLKQEWTRVKDDVHGRSEFNRAIRRKLMKHRKKDADWPATKFDLDGE